LCVIVDGGDDDDGDDDDGDDGDDNDGDDGDDDDKVLLSSFSVSSSTRVGMLRLVVVRHVTTYVMNSFRRHFRATTAKAAVGSSMTFLPFDVRRSTFGV